MAYCYCKNCKTSNVFHSVNKIYENNAAFVRYNSVDCDAHFLSFTIGSTKYKNKLFIFECNRCKYVTYRHGNQDNAEQIFPIEPNGEPLSEKIPEEIRKDFDEARLVVNYSIRSANVLMRLCTEKICNFIGEIFLKSNQEKIEKEILNNKISIIKSKNNYIGLNLKIFDMLTVLQKYGNENAHAIRTISDSDTKESFDALHMFVHLICKNIIDILEADEKLDQMNKEIQKKT